MPISTGRTDTPAMRPILCLDFDGVLHSYRSGWTGVGSVMDGPVPGAMRFLAEAVERFDVQVYSSRSTEDAGIQGMMRALLLWLHDELGAFEGAEVFLRLSFPRSKPSAFLTVDDRALTFTGTFPSIAELEAFTPWNRPGDG